MLRKISTEDFVSQITPPLEEIVNFAPYIYLGGGGGLYVRSFRTNYASLVSLFSLSWCRWERWGKATCLWPEAFCWSWKRWAVARGRRRLIRCLAHIWIRLLFDRFGIVSTRTLIASWAHAWSRTVFWFWRSTATEAACRSVSPCDRLSCYSDEHDREFPSLKRTKWGDVVPYYPMQRCDDDY